MRFVKMQGTGNDFVCLDGFREGLPPDAGALARKLCDRRFGIGADGLVLVGPERGVDARMVVYNADGSRADMCGNALRCVVLLLGREGHARKKRLRIATDQGTLEAALEEGGGLQGQVRVEAGRPRLERRDVPMVGGPPGPVVDERLDAAGCTWTVSALHLGNPHCVVWTDHLDGLDLERVGPAIAHHPAFPRRANAVFVEALSERRLRQRTWERGAGETLACGTGAAAALVAGVLSGRTRSRVTVQLRGGELCVAWPDREGPVLLTGKAAVVFQGEWALD